METYLVYKCPSCGYEIPELEFMYAKFNYPCPKCKEKRLSDYESMKKPKEIKNGTTVREGKYG